MYGEDEMRLSPSPARRSNGEGLPNGRIVESQRDPISRHNLHSESIK